MMVIIVYAHLIIGRINLFLLEMEIISIMDGFLVELFGTSFLAVLGLITSAFSCKPIIHHLTSNKYYLIT